MDFVTRLTAFASVLLLSIPAMAGDGPRIASLKPMPKATGSGSAPDGFVRMFVAGVLTTDSGPAVVLRDRSETRLLPIWIGAAEAHAIQLRLERRRFPRPLTHDLLDHVMQELGGSLIKIQVDDLKGSTFVGKIFIKKGGEVTRLDARPSDSIALALGNQAPIYVSERVLNRVERERKKAEKSGTDPKKGRAGDEGITTL